MILWNCKRCGEQLESPSSLIGEFILCPGCREAMRVPDDPTLERNRPGSTVVTGAAMALPKQPVSASGAKLKSLGTAALILFWIVAIGACFWLRDTESSDRNHAWFACQRYVKANLKAPGSASFGGLLDQLPSQTMTHLGGSRYCGQGWVEAQNGFGATVRTYFVCIVRGSGDDWQLEDVSFE